MEIFCKKKFNKKILFFSSPIGKGASERDSTSRRLRTFVCEHLVLSDRTLKPIPFKMQSNISNHLIQSSH